MLLYANYLVLSFICILLAQTGQAGLGLSEFECTYLALLTRASVYNLFTLHGSYVPDRSSTAYYIDFLQFMVVKIDTKHR